MIETAKKKKLAGIRFMAGDCENLHFAKNSFYAGTCSMSFTITLMHKAFPTTCILKSRSPTKSCTMEIFTRIPERTYSSCAGQAD